MADDKSPAQIAEEKLREAKAKLRVACQLASLSKFHTPMGDQAEVDAQVAIDIAAKAAAWAAADRDIQLCLLAVPRTHTYASENADAYRAWEEARNRCIHVIKTERDRLKQEYEESTHAK